MQRPQCSGLRLRSTSQPSSATPLQSAKPSSQRKPQTPAVQLPSAWGGEGHTRPQLPQWLMLLRVSVSQPFAGSRSQSRCVPLQVPTWQAPISQVAVPFATRHTLPHEPQLATFDAVFTHAPEQHDSPAPQPRPPEQPVTHTPPTQRLPLPQSPSTTQSTQRRVVGSHRGPLIEPASPPAPRHELSSRQPRTHKKVVGSQN